MVRASGLIEIIAHETRGMGVIRDERWRLYSFVEKFAIKNLKAQNSSNREL
jgi:hypothetical protein